MKHDAHHAAMLAVLHGMGKAAHHAKAQRFLAKRAPAPESAPIGGDLGNPPTPGHDMVELAMTPEEMDELVGGKGR